jgi:hypothetical protein
VNDDPMTQALLAARRHDLAGIRGQLDLLTDDGLAVLRHALWDVVTELRFTLRDRGCELGAFPVGDVCGDGSVRVGDRRCPGPDCGRRLDSPRARYCSGRCRMRALRQRRLLNAQLDVVEAAAPPARRPLDHYVYECTSCGERFLGERRCPECRLFNRNLGLGGPCPECDHPVVLGELVPDHVGVAPPLTTGGRGN